MLLYLILSGRYPFEATNRTELFDKIIKGEFTFHYNSFNNISNECKDIIMRMITVNKKKRITAEQMLSHPWLTKFRESGKEVELDSEVIDNLKRFKGQSVLKKAALNVLVKMLGPKDIQRLREQF